MPLRAASPKNTCLQPPCRRSGCELGVVLDGPGLPESIVEGLVGPQDKCFYVFARSIAKNTCLQPPTVESWGPRELLVAPRGVPAGAAAATAVLAYGVKLHQMPFTAWT